MVDNTNDALYLFWAIIVTIVLIIVAIKLNNLKNRHQKDISDLQLRHQEDVSKLQLQHQTDVSNLNLQHQESITELEKTKQSKAYQAGQNFSRGDINQVLGTMSLLTQYDEIILLSTTSKQSSIDLIGLNADVMDVIEIKSGNVLTKGEKRVKKLVEEGKVHYRIVDAELPVDFKIEDRENKNKDTEKDD